MKYSPSQERSVLHSSHLLASLGCPHLVWSEAFQSGASSTWVRAPKIRTQAANKGDTLWKPLQSNWQTAINGKEGSLVWIPHQWVGGNKLNKGFFQETRVSWISNIHSKCIHYVGSVIAALIAPFIFPTVLLSVLLHADRAGRVCKFIAEWNHSSACDSAYFRRAARHEKWRWCGRHATEDALQSCNSSTFTVETRSTCMRKCVCTSVLSQGGWYCRPGEEQKMSHRFQWCCFHFSLPLLEPLHCVGKGAK